MDDQEWLAERFEEHRPQLRAVAYRMLGSLSEADDAVQDAWLRLSRADTSEVENLGGMADDRRRARVAEHAPLAPVAARGACWACACPTRSSTAWTAPTPSTRRCSPTRSASRCWSCSRRSPPPSGSRSSCTTCSPCRSTRSRRSSSAPRRRPASSRAARAAASRAREPSPTPASTGSAKWSTPSSPPPATATSSALVAVLDPDVVVRADAGALPVGASREVRGAEAVAAPGAQ